VASISKPLNLVENAILLRFRHAGLPPLGYRQALPLYPRVLQRPIDRCAASSVKTARSS